MGEHLVNRLLLLLEEPERRDGCQREVRGVCWDTVMCGRWVMEGSAV